MSKRKTALIAGILLSGLVFCPLQNSFGQPLIDKTHYATGGRLPTPDELAKFHKTHARITNVRMNTIWLDRENRVRALNHLPRLDQISALPMGQEIESVKDAGSTATLTGGMAQAAGGTAPVLTSIDNTTDPDTSPFFPPIGNQGQTTDCQSWASVYYQLTYMNAMAKNMPLSSGGNINANIFSPRWVFSQINGAVNEGAGLGQDFAILEQNGASTIANDVDYNNGIYAWDNQNPAHWQAALSARINPVQYLVSASTSSSDVSAWINQIKALLNNGYILTFQTNVYAWQFTTISTADVSSYVGQTVAYAQEVIPCNQLNALNCVTPAQLGCSLSGPNCVGNATYSSEGSHDMTIVGYDDKIVLYIQGHLTTGAFKIANSWGLNSGWGNGGFFWLAYDALYSTTLSGASFPAGTFDSNLDPLSGRTPAIWNDEVYEMTVKPNYTPKLIAQFTVDQPQRGQLQMFLGTSATTASSPTMTNINDTTAPYQSAFNQQGGPLMFPGKTDCTGTTYRCQEQPNQSICAAAAATNACYWGSSSDPFCLGGCSNVSDSTCSTTPPPGCAYGGSGTCWGSSSVCSTLSASACNTYPGCQSGASGAFVLDFTDFLPCTGTPAACGTISSPSVCSSQSGCTWSNSNGVCSGTAALCSTFSPSGGSLSSSSCSSQLGCQVGSSGPLNFYLGMTDHGGTCNEWSWYYKTPATCAAAGLIWLQGPPSTLTSYQLIDLTTNPPTVTQASGLPVSANGNVASQATKYAVIPYNFTVYTITASQGEGGSISPYGTMEFGPGNTQTYTLTPATGYKSMVSIDGATPVALASNSYTFSNISASHTIAASFVPIPNVTLTINYSGAAQSTTISTPAGIDCVNHAATTAGCVASFPQGSTVALTATEGSGILSWNGTPGCTDSTLSCTLVMKSNLTINVSDDK